MVVLAILLSPSIPPSIHANQTNESEHYNRVVSSDPVDHPKEYIISDTELCNCYAYQKERFFPDLPGTATILTGLNQDISDLVVFYYADSDLYHYAKVIDITNTSILVDETNYYRCKRTVRAVDKNDPTIVGYWHGKK